MFSSPSECLWRLDSVISSYSVSYFHFHIFSIYTSLCGTSFFSPVIFSLLPLTLSKDFFLRMDQKLTGLGWPELSTLRANTDLTDTSSHVATYRPGSKQTQGSQHLQTTPGPDRAAVLLHKSQPHCTANSAKIRTCFLNQLCSQPRHITITL